MASKRILTRLSDFVSMADIFNDPIYLNMKGRRKLATSLGGMLSVGMIAFLLCLGILQSVSMFSRDDPQIYQITELEDDPTAVYLNTTNNFMFAITISEYSQFINMSLNSPFSFTLTYSQYIRFTNGTRIKYKNKVNWGPCTEDMFPSNIYGEDVFSAYGLAYAYCPISINYNASGSCPPQILALYPNCIGPLDFKITGAYLSLDFEFMQFNLNPCKSTDVLPVGFKCTTENVANLLNTREYKVNLFYANNVLNPMNYKVPSQTYIETIYWDLNPIIYKIADIFTDKLIAQDYDSYWSTTSYQNHTYYSILPEKMRELQVWNTVTGTALLQWNIRRSSNNIVTTRTYSKIQDIMTDLGSFSNAVMFMAAFLAFGYVEYKYQLTLSNEFYDFQLTEVASLRKKKKDPQGKAYQANKPSQPGLAFIQAMGLLKKEDGPMEKATKAVQDYFALKKEERQEIRIGLFNYFKTVARWLTCRRNAEDEVAERARNLVQEELDIIRVIQKLKEIDKLKVLLLNRYQREVFNFIEKPLVTLENEKPVHLDSMLPDLSFELNESEEEEDNQLNPKIQSTREEYESLPKYAKLYMTYRYLMEDKNPGHQKYNKKLFDMLGDDLIEVFRKIDQVMDENPDPRKFDEIVKTVFKTGEENDAE